MFIPQDPSAFGTTVSRIWTFNFFIILFRDIHEMSTAATISGILEGHLDGNPVTDAGLVVGGSLIVLLLLTSFLSTLLKPHLVRRLNLVMAPLALVGSFYLPPNDPDDYLLVTVSAIAMLAIIAMCWRPRPTLAGREVRHAV